MDVSVTAASIKLDATLSGTLRAAVAESEGGAQLLDEHAGRIPTGGTVTASAHGDSAQLTFTWQASGKGPLLLMALPHHAPRLSGVGTTALRASTLVAPVHHAIA